MKILFSSILILYSFSYTTSVFAKCNAVANLIEINGRDIIVDNNTPVGTLLGNFTSGSYQTYSCDNKTANNMTSGGKAYGEFATKINNIRVYKTNIAGIGYSVGFQSMCNKAMLYPSTGWRGNIDSFAVCKRYGGIWNKVSHKFNIRIYKIGPTGNGTFKRKQVGATIFVYNDYKVWAEENPIFLKDFKITTIDKNNNNINNNNNNNDNKNHHIWPSNDMSNNN